MRDFHCRDLGANCEFVARGETVEEVLEQTRRHAEGDHRMPFTPDLAARLTWLVHDRTSPAHLESVQRNS